MIAVPAMAYASEADLVVWLTIFPAQYLFILASLFMVKLGFRRKTLLIASFIFGHFVFIPALDSMHGHWIYKIPELFIAILPSVYWIVLMIVVCVLKSRKIFEDVDQLPPSFPTSGV